MKHVDEQNTTRTQIAALAQKLFDSTFPRSPLQIPHTTWRDETRTHFFGLAQRQLQQGNA